MAAAISSISLSVSNCSASAVLYRVRPECMLARDEPVNFDLHGAKGLYRYHAHVQSSLLEGIPSRNHRRVRCYHPCA